MGETEGLLRFVTTEEGRAELQRIKSGTQQLPNKELQQEVSGEAVVFPTAGEYPPDASLEFFFTNPDLQKYRDAVSAGVDNFASEAHNYRTAKLAKEHGVSGARVLHLLDVLERTNGLDPLNLTHVLFGLHFIKDVVDQAVFPKLVVNAQKKQQLLKMQEAS